MDFTDTIRHWVALDNRIKRHNVEVKAARVERNELTADIIAYADSNGMRNATVQITDGKLKFQDTRITAPLTFKFVKRCLTECIGDASKVEQLIKYMKEQREVLYVSEIKRSYNS